MAWYNDNWSHRKKITIDSANVDDDLTDFPVLIHLDSDSELANAAQSDGNDILFTQADGETKLSHEIESYDDGTGTLWAHVKSPNLSSSSDTEIYVYYGDSDASNQEDVSDVWSNGFEAVYHLSEDNGPYQDSTSNDNDGTDNVSATGQDGQIGDGQEFDGNGDYIEAPSDPSLEIGTSDYSIFTWVNLNQVTSNHQVILSHRQDYLGGGNSGYDYLVTANDGLIRTVIDDGNEIDVQDSDTQVPTGSYTSIGVSVERSTSGTFYQGGQSDGTFTPTAPGDLSNSRALRIGAQEDDVGDIVDSFDGFLDEIRISSALRSSSWISTTHTNQDDPGSFYTVGSEEQLPIDFTVTITSTNSPVQFGNDLDVVSDITNEGRDGSRDITLSLDSGVGQVDIESGFTLTAGETQEVTLSWSTTEGDIGEYTATVDAEDNQDTTAVEVVQLFTEGLIGRTGNRAIKQTTGQNVKTEGNGKNTVIKQ